MKKFYLILLMLYYCSYKITTAQTSNTNRNSALAKSINLFGYSLFKTMNSKLTGNFVISPFSTAAILSTICIGAEGNAGEELREALNLTITNRELALTFETYLSQLINHNSNNEIEFAHFIFMNDHLQFNPEYNRMLNEYFSAEIVRNNFRDETKIINSMIHGTTNNKIRTVIPPGLVNNNTAVLLTDAFYFGGSWVYPFSRENTARKEFHVAEDEKMIVMSMHLTAMFELYESSDPPCDVLELPLESSFSLYIIRPEIYADMQIFGELLTPSFFETIVNHKGFEERLVAVDLPKFFLTTRIGLKPYLQALGITDIFDENENHFPNMLQGNMKIYVNKIVQKTVVKFEEEESKDNFVQEYGCRNSFNVDHPFIFLVIDKIQNVILLMGRIVDPNAKNFNGPI